MKKIVINKSLKDTLTKKDVSDEAIGRLVKLVKNNKRSFIILSKEGIALLTNVMETKRIMNSNKSKYFFPSTLENTRYAKITKGTKIPIIYMTVFLVSNSAWSLDEYKKRIRK
jgi:hypothetical protein